MVNDSDIRTRIDADLKDAMRAKDRVRLEALRSVISQFGYRRIELNHDLTADEQTEVIRRLVKQRNDSIVEFAKAGREELVEKETRERDILKAYLPPELSHEELAQRLQLLIADLPETERTQGGIMKRAMSELRGQADGGLIRRMVEEALKA